MGCSNTKIVPSDGAASTFMSAIGLTSTYDFSKLSSSAGTPEVMKALDKIVISCLERGIIRLVRASYVLNLKPGALISRQQDLRQTKNALVSPREAAAAVAAADRRVLVLSYGWLGAGQPDPFGRRLEAVQRALRWLKAQGALRKDAALFWDYASLCQKPRTESEDEEFKEGLQVMANLFASALATTVLQLAEVPTRPRSEVGAIRACRLPAGYATAANLTPKYARFGAIKAVDIRGDDEATIRFEEREAAIKALYFDPKALGLGESTFVCHEYNDRPYGDRGWCCFEDAVSIEFLARSRKPGNGALRTVMDAPRCGKIYEISSTADPRLVEPAGPQERLVVQRRIEAATFTGTGDGKVVLDMYKRFQLDAANATARVGVAAAAEGKTPDDLSPDSKTAARVEARRELALEQATARARAAKEMKEKTSGQARG